MKVVKINRYGGADELQVVDIPMPVCKANELLVRNKVATVNPYDCMARNGDVKMLEGFRFPKILGSECSGVVEEVGSAVRTFKKGDSVIVTTGRNGAYSEFVSVSESKVAPLPESVSFSHGASLPVAGTSAYDALHKLGEIKDGYHVLINGAYGSMGSFAVQLAKLAGATVTASCSAASFEMVKAIGADEVVDYTQTDFLKTGKQYDIILDTPSVWKFSHMKDCLTERGVLIGTLPTPVGMITQLITSFGKRKYRVLFADPTKEKISLLANLVREGKCKVIVDREYGVHQIADAHRYSETKRAKGKIVIRF